MFPSVDPIPLPAPVWLFKILHHATMTLHFAAVHFLVGGLFVAALWSILGRSRKNSAMQSASGEIAERLPLVLTFVINLGIPPLLFTQVLYGRAIYTSSVLIGFYWLAVIFLVIIAYNLLYYMNHLIERNRAGGWAGLIALVILLKVGLIYSANMSLMLRPDLWQEAYRADSNGATFLMNPTTMPRWLFMMLGSIGMGGVGLLLLGLRGSVDADAAQLMRRTGGKLLSVFMLVQIALGLWVYSAQPEGVRAGLSGSAVYIGLAVLWGLTALALVVLGWKVSSTSGKSALPYAISAIAFVNLLFMVLVRDGIRDISLRLNGYEVWDRAVYANWSTIGLFLRLFVVAVALVLWMGYVMLRAKPASQEPVQ